MNFELKALSLSAAAALKCDLLIVPISSQSGDFSAQQEVLPQWLAAAITHKDVSTEAGSQLQAYQVAGIKARRVLVLGTGQGSAKELRSALLGAASALKAPAVEHAALCLSALDAPDVAIAVQALHEALYHYQHTKPSAKVPAIKKLTLGVPNKRAAEAAFTLGQAIAAGQTTAKEWGNRPANHATPSHLAEVAQALGKAENMRCKIHGPKEVAKLGMHAFMAVAQGSKEPLQLIELHYQGAAKTEAPVVLVGKGITFDTGGISIKPAAAMDEMKFDMCGAASVLGVFTALAQLQPAINVVGLIPACENMPDGAAVKPGDVVTSMSGQTIEILNTDAEGRLVLCDALTYVERFKPFAVIDVATLTGACITALGHHTSGLLSNNDSLANEVFQAGEQASDAVWRLPMNDKYQDQLKSNFADMANIGGAPGGTITAACFLSRFTANYPWAHLDIAGTAWRSGAAKGATGRPVPLLCQILLNHAKP